MSVLGAAGDGASARGSDTSAGEKKDIMKFASNFDELVEDQMCDLSFRFTRVRRSMCVRLPQQVCRKDR